MQATTIIVAIAVLCNNSKLGNPAGILARGRQYGVVLALSVTFVNRNNHWASSLGSLRGSPLWQ
jgi:hypothetical protein